MVNSVIATVALFGASVSASVGSAHVINKCSYDVYSCIVPAQGGGQEQKDLTLKPGDTWDQQWTELTNGAGWSIKFSHDEGQFGSNILQYEYTFHNDGNIWYDLSCVDGNPWDKNWEITSSTDECAPKQQAYRYATDDAYGMQHCSQDASITVTLCSGEAADNSTGSDNAPSYDSAPAAISSAPVYQQKAVVPTTLATVVSSADANNNVLTITKTITAYATEAVVMGNDGVPHVQAKRHQHHPHGHSEE